MKFTPLFWISLSLVTGFAAVTEGGLIDPFKSGISKVAEDIQQSNAGTDFQTTIDQAKSTKDTVFEGFNTGTSTLKGVFSGEETLESASTNIKSTVTNSNSAPGSFTPTSPIATAFTTTAGAMSFQDTASLLTEENIKHVTSLLGVQNTEFESYSTADVVANGINALLESSQAQDGGNQRGGSRTGAELLSDSRGRDGRIDTSSSSFQTYLGLASSYLEGSSGETTVDLGGSGLQWSFSSKSFLETALSLAANGPSTWETLQSVGSGEIAMADLLGVLADMDMTCGWQASVGGNSNAVNINFRDKNEVLHLQIIPQTLDSQAIWIKGNYPKAKYFSYQSYIVSRSGGFTATGSIADFQISGRGNPYTAKNFDESKYNVDDEYDIYFTTDGSKGYENEVAYNPDGLEEDGQFIVLAHHLVLDENIPLAQGSKVWGGVNSPAIRVKALDIARTGAWFLIPSCNGKNDAVVEAFIDNQLGRIETVREVDVQCPLANIDNNFIATDQLQYFDIKYEDHITSCGSKNVVDGDLITVVEGILPAKNSVRYSSFSIVDLLPPGVTKATITDDQIRSYYDASDDEDVKYNIVLAPTQLVLNRCGLTNLPNYAFIKYVPMGNTMNPGIIYREVVGQNFEGRTRDTSLYNALDLCEKQGDCYNPLFFNATMQEFYPQVQYFQCNFFGKLSKAPVGDYTWTNPNFPTEIPTPSWVKLERENPELCVPKLEMKVTTKSAYDLYVDGEQVGFYSGFDGFSINQPALKGWGPTIIPADNTTADVRDKLITDVPEVATIAVKFPKEGESIVIDMNACGEGMGTDYNWKCTDKPENDDWYLPDFDDSKWPYAGILSTAEIVDTYPGISYNPDHTFAITPQKCPSKSRFLSNLYCRGTMKLSCTRYCTSSKVEKYSSFCKDEKKRVGIAHVSSPAQLDVYANNRYMGKTPTGGKTSTLLFNVPDSNTRFITFAIKAVDYSARGLRSAFIGDFSVCGIDFLTNNIDWKCTNEIPEEGWHEYGYDDSDWQSAVVTEGANGVKRWGYAEGVSPEAYWIWSNEVNFNGMSTIHCRATIENPLFQL